MKFTFASLALLLAPVLATASPVSYLINFTADSPGAGGTPTGSFTYDAATPAFSNFLVEWNSVVFDLTAQANDAWLGTGGAPPIGLTPIDPPACLNGATGAAAAFALMSQADCNAATAGTIFQGWQASYVPRVQTTFQFLHAEEAPVGDPMGIYVKTTQGAGLGEFAEGSGQYSIEAVPEPSTLVLTGVAGLGIALASIRRRRKG